MVHYIKLFQYISKLSQLNVQTKEENSDQDSGTYKYMNALV